MGLIRQCPEFFDRVGKVTENFDRSIYFKPAKFSIEFIKFPKFSTGRFFQISEISIDRFRFIISNCRLIKIVHS